MRHSIFAHAHRTLCTLSALALAFGGLALSGQSAAAAVIVDPTSVNVLRQYDGTFTQQIIRTGTGSFNATDGNDGSGSYDHANIPLTSSVTSTYTLPGPRTVSSYRTDYHVSYRPTNFLLEGLVSGVWTTLANLSPPGGNQAGSFAAQEVTAVRYTATGPSTSPPYNLVGELQVFLDSGQPTSTASGFNFLRGATGTTTNQSAENGTVWSGTSGSGAAMRDGNYVDGHVHSQFDHRAFVSASLSGSARMEFAHLGWYNGQAWTGWEMYTSNAAAIPPTQSLGGNSPATIQAAGWTLQHSSPGSGGQRIGIPLATPGDWRHVLLVWNSVGGQGALTELELYDFATPQLTASPISGSTIDFGKVLAGTTTTLTNAILLENTGEAGSLVEVTGFSITGLNAAQFDIPDFAPITLMAGATDSVLFDVEFTAPDGEGLYTALLTINTSEGDVLYNLQATVFVPEPSTLALLGLGAIGLAARIRRRRATA